MRLMYSIHQFDVRMFIGLNSSGIHANLIRVCRLISWSADGFLYVALALGLYWHQGPSSPLLQSLLLAFALERPVYFVLKNGFKRNRSQQSSRIFAASLRRSI